MKVAMIDLIGEYNKWMAFNLTEETEIIAYITKDRFINGDGNFILGKDYDVMLIAENDIKDKDFLDAMFRCLGISEKKVIFINDLNSWLSHETIAYEILKDKNISRRHTEFFTWRKFGKFASVTVDDISYFGESDNDKIMGDMYINNKSFAKDELENFYNLSDKFYPKRDGKYFLDIGANIGAINIYFYKKLDPDIKILAFEADALTYKILACNLILNDMLDVVKTEDLALGENNENSVALDNYLKTRDILNSEIKYIWINAADVKIIFGSEYLLEHSSVPITIKISKKLYAEKENFKRFLEILKKYFKNYIVLKEVKEDDMVLHKIDDLKNYKDEETEFSIFLIRND